MTYRPKSPISVDARPMRKRRAGGVRCTTSGAPWPLPRIEGRKGGGGCATSGGPGPLPRIEAMKGGGRIYREADAAADLRPAVVTLSHQSGSGGLAPAGKAIAASSVSALAYTGRLKKITSRTGSHHDAQRQRSNS